MAASDGASSISVTVRVRPFTIREAAQLTKCDDGPLFLGDGSLAAVPTPKLSQKGVRPVIKVVDDRCLVFDPPEDNPVQRFSRSVVPQGRRVKDQTFAFDKVFDENTSQGDVYEATTKNLLDSVLDGYNATVFAYGATGCGKTHTITGTAQQPGIIFLTMQELFERISDMSSEKNTEISLSYLEIYNETIRDLLVPGGSKAGLMLREDSNQAVSVAGLSSHHPHDVNEVMDMIVRGNEYRTISPTEANATSSRSHAVLQINVTQKDRNADVNEPHTMATLSIIDLAGSERASATKNRGERLIEGANINKSLLALGSCINALCDPRKRNHVPYRNSKLTRLLKFSLGGNCKTVMIVCVSPSSQHFDETQNTLRYANRAKNIQTKVTRNVFNVNRHVKDFLKKIDEQIILINELKQQQKDYENIAFGKFKKQAEKKESLLREGIQRLRNAHDHSAAEKQERITSMKKLRQIERRIATISSWVAAFDSICEMREEEEPPVTLVALRKQAQGILIELESSRQHYHQRLAKSTWHRTVDAALQTGLKQLNEADAGKDGPECLSLQREADLLKSDAEREFYSATLETDKVGDAALMQVLLHANFDTAAMINQLLQMDEEEAIAAAKSNLRKILTACCDATSRIIKLDGSLPLVEAFPPTKSGTPKRRKHTEFIGPSPLNANTLPNMADVALLVSSPLRTSPIKISPRKRVLGSAKRGISFTPKRKSPVKRAVRWRDDTEDGKLADYEKTPQRLDSTPEVSSAELPTALRPTIIDATDATEVESSPLPDPPQISMDLKPKKNRFETGFLSKPSNGSPATRILSGLSSSPEPSPLQEIENNRAAGRISDNLSTLAVKKVDTSDFGNISPPSDSEKSWGNDKSDAVAIKKVMRRASMSRFPSVKDTSRSHRRRSPPTSSSCSPSNENSLFTASHARRMVKSDRDNDWRASVLSPHISSITKTSGARRTTISEDRGLQRSACRPSNNRFSTLASSGVQRASMVPGSATKMNWR